MSSRTSSWAIENGLAMKSAAPSRMASTARSTVPWAVMITTVVSGCSALIRFSRSIPPSRGITRSVSTRSCRCCSKRATPLTPSSATSTIQPSLRRASAMVMRSSGSSSTISSRRPQMVIDRSLFLGHRLEAHPENRALANRRLHLDGSAVGRDDAVAHRQPETGAFTHLAGGEERIEDPVADLLRNADPGVTTSAVTMP